jgi:hypothetical protein
VSERNVCSHAGWCVHDSECEQNLHIWEWFAVFVGETAKREYTQCHRSLSAKARRRACRVPRAVAAF